MLEEETCVSSSTKYRYECSQCDYKTNKKSNHDSHIKFVHQKEKDICPECQKPIANLNQHLRVTHKIFKANTREKVCEHCNKKFHNLEAHKLKAHNVKPPAEFFCNICSKAFAKKDHLARHESVVHLGQRKTCPYCSNQFVNLERHIKTKHTATNPMVKETVKVLYPCNLCNKVFKTKAVLNTHKQTLHGVETSNNKETCPFCSKQFSNLSQHIEIIHNDTKKYSCQKCGKRFYDNRELRRHHIKYLKTGECHKESAPDTCKFNCDYENCNYKTNKKSNLEMHKASVHLNLKFPCPECGKELSSKANLNSHVKNVHDKRLVGGVLEKNTFHLSFRCKLCDYTTNRALHLDRHMLSVHSEAAFETVEQVYHASTQPRLPNTPDPDMKPTVTNLIKTHHPRSNAKLPQFANLVRLEKVSADLPEDEDEMILGAEDSLVRDDLDLTEDIQFVTTTPEGVHMIRRVSTDSALSASQDTIPGLDEHQVNIIYKHLHCGTSPTFSDCDADINIPGGRQWEADHPRVRHGGAALQRRGAAHHPPRHRQHRVAQGHRSLLTNIPVP